MKKQTLIIIILCVLVAAVVALSVTGVIGPQDGGSLAGYTKATPTVSPLNTIANVGKPWDHSWKENPGIEHMKQLEEEGNKMVEENLQKQREQAAKDNGEP